MIINSVFTCLFKGDNIPTIFFDQLTVVGDDMPHDRSINDRKYFSEVLLDECTMEIDISKV